MPRFQIGRAKTGGRKKGTPNKKTKAMGLRQAVAEEVKDALAREEVARQQRPDEPEMPIYGGKPLQEYVSRGVIRPLAKDELSNLVSMVKGVLAAFENAALYDDKSGAPDKQNFEPVRWNRFQAWLFEISGSSGETLSVGVPIFASGRSSMTLSSTSKSTIVVLPSFRKRPGYCEPFV